MKPEDYRISINEGFVADWWNHVKYSPVWKGDWIGISYSDLPTYLKVELVKIYYRAKLSV